MLALNQEQQPAAALHRPSCFLPPLPPPLSQRQDT